MNGGLWKKILNPDNVFRRKLINQVVPTALPKCKSPDQISAAIKAFMNTNLTHEVIKLLNKIVLQSSSFIGNFNLNGLSTTTAIKTYPKRVMGYINRLDNFDGSVAIFKKFNLNVQAINALLDNLQTIDRAMEFAFCV
ncbi:unnamed protein product [Vicia faba]|uniref:Uncharacterized protein n=1 Tax=Vicia faba TaxID=3906 RepID=A0AAV0ZMN6_VICFA|nr:unnamed protein product [Vicia faba]